MEPQAKYDLIQELINGVNAHKATAGSTIVNVAMTESDMTIGLTEILGNLKIDSQYKVSLGTGTTP